MCGFGGFLESERAPRAEVERRRILERMARQLAHRGPDDQQLHDTPPLSLAFRRLAIIDVDGGTQPIWNEDRSLMVVINGEIYNHAELRAQLRGHTFRSRSDAEVFLHLYEERGPAALDALNGIFAIVLWDARARQLFLARDRMGVKPLYYARARSGTFLFGSELKALLAHPDCPRDVRWQDVGLSAVGPPHGRLSSYVEGVEQLPGGWYATLSGGRLRRTRYWSLPQPDPDDPSIDDAAYADRYADLLEDAVRLNAVSDVPIGVCLSGGLDSATVAAALARQGTRAPCFSVIERSTFLSGDAGAAEEIARLIGAPFHGALFDLAHVDRAGELSLEVFEYLVWLLDSPRFTIDWYIRHELARFAKALYPSLKVLLLGQGADEFAGGYSNPYERGEDEGWERYLERLARDRLGRAADRAQVHGSVAPWLTRGMGGPPRLGREYRSEMLRRLTVLQTYNLWHEDRTAAAHGLEARVPFLDHRLVEFLARVPIARQAGLFWDKRIVRAAARRWLPERYVSRPKVGFLGSKDTSSVDAASARILASVYPAFRESYLEGPRRLFRREPLDGMFARAQAGGPSGAGATRALFGCMAAAVFERLTREGGSGDELAVLRGPLPVIQTGADVAGWRGEVDEEAPVISASSRVSFDPAVAVVLPVADDEALAFVRDGRVERQLRLDSRSRWLLALVRALARAKRPMRVSACAKKIGVPASFVCEALALFHEHGWIRRH